MPSIRARAAGAALSWLAVIATVAPAAAADEAIYYKGKRLTVLVNFAAGGPTDIEGRLFAKYIARHIEGQPATIVQNMDGAGGLVGNSYLGEIAPKDGTMVGYFTGAAWLYATEPSKHRVDFRTYEFIAYQPGTTVYYVRTDVAPGLKEPTDIVKAQGLVTGGLSADSSKDLLIRLTLDMLGVPFKYVTGYRSNQNARLALQQNEINFFAESPPGYRSVVEPSLVKNGQVIPLYYDPGWNGESITRAQADRGAVDPAVPGALPEDQGRRALRQAVGRLSLEPRHQCRHAAPGGAAARSPAGGGRYAADRGAAAQRRSRPLRRRRWARSAMCPTTKPGRRPTGRCAPRSRSRRKSAASFSTPSRTPRNDRGSRHAGIPSAQLVGRPLGDVRAGLAGRGR